MNGEPWTAAEQTALIELVEDGWTAADIAKQLDRPITSIHQKGQYFGLSFTKPSGDKRKGAKLTDKDITQIRALRKLGWSPKQIHEEFPHITKPYISMICSNKRRKQDG